MHYELAKHKKENFFMRPPLFCVIKVFNGKKIQSKKRDKTHLNFFVIIPEMIFFLIN